MTVKNNILLCVVLLSFTSVLRAQTGGPGQPEFMQFQQAGTSGLVSPTTGSFTYQIPLFTIGGYPMNLTYQSGIMMEDVASMVGLGWNLNAGSIVRNLRGIADDFNGDAIIRDFSIKPNETYGGKVDVDLEIAGLPESVGISVGAGLGVFYNNYKGWGLEPSLRGSLSASFQSNGGVGGSASLGMGISCNSQSGVDRYIAPSVGLKLGKGNDKLSISLGKTWSVNSNEGLRESINGGLSYTRYKQGTKKDEKTGKTVADHTQDQSFSATQGFTQTSYLNNSFQPDIDYPFVNTSGTYSGTLGGDLYYVDPSARVTGYFSKQNLATTSQTFGAYGAMYERDALPGNSMMDFNREKKLPYFIGESKILPIPFKTPDLFNLNAQGLSMTFSVLKNDIGVVGDAKAMVVSNGSQGGAEVNLGQLFKAGGNFGTTNSTQNTGRWDGPGVPFEPYQSHVGTTLHPELYQQWCFKNHGEMNSLNQSLFDRLGGYNPIRFEVEEQTISSILNNGSLILPAFNEEQPVRQSTISYLTAKEATTAGFDKKINYFPFNSNSWSTVLQSEDRVLGERKGHHLSEISVTQPDGMKYVFGLPIYNLSQKEVTFNVSGNVVDCAKNLVSYNPPSDNSTGNTKGLDHFYESTFTPAYATQFLITSVISPDYRDLTNDGISDDDLGNFVKFTYFKDNNYNWRTPTGLNKATYNKGLRSDNQDDKGTYVYGVKELYYVRSIESKTEIATFHYSYRNDGYGVDDENGRITVATTTQKLRKLDSIVIYSIPDRIANGNAAIPIKTVHFDYTKPANSLCKNIDNGSTPTTGKLTLDNVSFTYEKSRKGRLTPYKFGYGKRVDPVNQTVSIINPNYNPRDVNRWGYFQTNTGLSDCSDLTSATLSNIDFPYASQDTIEMDKNAFAWNLTDITIPGGGKLNVDYESHDYSYIQDKPVGQMFSVKGFSDLSSSNLSTSNLLSNNSIINSRLYFKLNSPLTGANASQILQQDYIKDIKDGYLYYKFLVKLRDIDAISKYEYIPGYAKINGWGISANNPLYGYVDLVNATVDEDISNGCNPIQKSAIQFMRINRNQMLYSGTQPPIASDFGSFIQSVPSIFGQIGDQLLAADGVGAFCISRGYCNEVQLDKSFIRLYNPIKKKLAGGSRVKRVSINDDWDDMTGNTHDAASYTTSYDYTTNERDSIISSGVAEYEPLLGGDEISLKQPIFYSDVKRMAPDNDYYVEKPVNESLFPSPQITYGKVTQTTNANNLVPKVGKTGKIVNEFFTAKDYPVKVGMTGISEKRDKSEFKPFQFPFVAIDQQHDFATVSQGYSIELNNMSGQAKATWVYNENGDRISGEVSEYFPNNENITTIDRTGKISTNKRLGLSAEYTIDGRLSKDKSTTSIFSANLNMSIILIYTVPIIMPLYSQMTEEKQFQSFAFNKLLRRNGILRRKVVYEQSSSVSTENLAFDEVTGEALLTKTTNEFNDSLFSFNYPAHWMYSGMSPSYVNSRLQVNNFNLNTFKQFLKVGDELRATNMISRLWVKSKTPLMFQNDYGAAISPLPSDYLVYTSASKNLLTSSAGKVVTWNSNPLDVSGRLKFDKDSILNSSAIEYYDDAVSYCDSCDNLNNRIRKNSFCNGMKGIWKPKQTWFYLTDRTPLLIPTGETNIKKQGLFKNYHDFWTSVPSTPDYRWTPTRSGWEWKEKVDLTDVDGQTIQTHDRIGRRVANLLGYKNTLITAQANNAGYGEAFFDGFEDYYCSYCPFVKLPQISKQPHHVIRRMNLVSGMYFLEENESHTGKYSIEIASDLTVTVLPPINCNGTQAAAESEPPLERIQQDITIINTTPVSKKPKGKFVTPEKMDKNLKVDKLDQGTVKEYNPQNNQHHIDNCQGCIGGFFPLKNKKYLFSCWVKVDHPQPIISCSDATVEINSPGGTSVTLHAEGPVIEDWQRVMGTFTTGSTSNNISITLKKGDYQTFYDDLRIVPADGNMVSYVYNEYNLRMTYSLDENNYYTKNEYNNQGELIRIKKETEKGIITIKEGNQSLVKKQ